MYEGMHGDEPELLAARNRRAHEREAYMADNCDEYRQRRPSIIVEDYEQMEVLMKQVVLLAPRITAVLSTHPSLTEALHAQVDLQSLVNRIQRHLED